MLPETPHHRLIVTLAELHPTPERITEMRHKFSAAGERAAAAADRAAREARGRGDTGGARKWERRAVDARAQARTDRRHGS